MRRMAAAIERAIAAVTINEKDMAARWAAAWGLLCGIKTKPVAVKRSDVIRLHGDDNAGLDCATIGFPVKVSAPAQPESGIAALMPAQPAQSSGDAASQA